MTPPDSDRLADELLRHGPFLRRLARSLVRDEHAAEDLVHDTWLAALRGAPAGSRDLRAWLATVLQRRATSRLRSQRSATDERYAEERSTLAPSAASTVLGLERERLLLDAVESLAEPYRTTVYLRYREELPPRRIAARLDVPVKTVATRLERGRAQLRQRLDGSFSERDDPRSAWLAALAPLATPARNPSLSAPASLMTKIAVSTASLALVGWLLYPAIAGGGEPSSTEAVEVAGLEAAAATAGAEVSELTPEAASSTRTPLSRASDSLGTLEVVVVDASGEGVPDLPVSIQSPQFAGRRRTVEWRSTDADGSASFTGLAPGRYFVIDGFRRACRVEQGVPLIGATVTIEAGGNDQLTLSLQSGLLVRGRVLLPDGSAAAGAELWAARSGAHADAQTRIATADDAGRFELAADEELEVQAARAGHVPSNGHDVRHMAEVEPGVREVEFVLGPVGSRLTGRVVDAAGEPIAGACVGAGPIGGSRSGGSVGTSPRRVTVRTDDDGRFTYPFGLPNGRTVVSVNAPGFGATVTEVNASGAPLEVQVALRPGARISGVVRTQDGSPAEGVYVVAHAPGDWIQLNVAGSRTTDVPVVATRTADDGTYELVEVTAGKVSLQSATPHGVTLEMARTELDLEPGDVRQVDLALGEGDVIAGRVVDRDGVPVEGIRMSAEGRLLGDALVRVNTGEDGSFRLTNLQTGRGQRYDAWTILARTLSARSIQELARIDDVAVGTEDLVIAIDRPITATGFLQGRLVADTPRVPADIEFTVWRADTNSGSFASFDPDSGQFRYGPVPPGEYRISLRRSEEVVAMRSGIVVAEGETVDVGAIVLGSGGHVAVTSRLADRLGLPAQIDDIVYGAGRATIVHENGHLVWLELDEGRWVSRELLESGTWTLRAEGERTLYPTIEFEVVDGETTELECLARFGHEVQARVQMPDEGWERVRIAMGHVDDGLVHRTEWRSRGDEGAGVFELTLPVGEVRIAVEVESGVLVEERREVVLMELPPDVLIDAR
ncbi:MAG: sigma-70 family RNA polymerase sigma factor [Planctomycetota bacterium]